MEERIMSFGVLWWICIHLSAATDWLIYAAAHCKNHSILKYATLSVTIALGGHSFPVKKPNSNQKRYHNK